MFCTNCGEKIADDSMFCINCGVMIPKKSMPYNEAAPAAAEPEMTEAPVEAEVPAEEPAPTEAETPAEEPAPAEAETPAEEPAPVEAEAPADEKKDAPVAGAFDDFWKEAVRERQADMETAQAAEAASQVSDNCDAFSSDVMTPEQNGVFGAQTRVREAIPVTTRREFTPEIERSNSNIGQQTSGASETQSASDSIQWYEEAKRQREEQRQQQMLRREQWNSADGGNGTATQGQPDLRNAFMQDPAKQPVRKSVPKKKKSKKALWIVLIIIAACILLFGCCCCGCLGFGILGEAASGGSSSGNGANSTLGTDYWWWNETNE